MVEDKEHLAETDHGRRREGDEDGQGQGETPSGWNEGDPLADVEELRAAMLDLTGLKQNPMLSEFERFIKKPLWAASSRIMTQWRTWVFAWQASEPHAIKRYSDAQNGCMAAGYALLRRRDKRFRDALTEIACFEQGDEVTSQFDHPPSARIARKALKPVMKEEQDD